MKTSVTKKKLTLKTKKAAPVPEPQEQAPTATPAVATGVVDATVVDTSSHKPAFIAAILAALVFLGLIAIQIIEWVYYQTQPSVWPPKMM